MSGDLIDELVISLPADPEKLSRSIVVFPGKRPAHFLRKRLAEKIGRPFLPPRIFALNTFVTFLYADILKNSPEILEPADAAALLYDIHQRGKQPLGHYSSFDDFLPVGLNVLSELEEVMLSNLDARRVGEALRYVEFPKFHSLGFYYAEFYALLDRLGYVTRSMMYRKVFDHLDDIDLSAYEFIALAGFYSLAQTEADIVRHLASRPNVSLFFQEGPRLTKRLDRLGISFESSVRPEKPFVSFYKSPDSHGQVLALAAILKERVNQPPDERTAIVLPSPETLFPLLHHALSVIPDEGYNISLGYPLSRTPVLGFLNGLLDLVASARDGKFSGTAYLQFVLHPYTKNIRFRNRSDVTRIAFHVLEEFLAGRRQLFSLEDLEAEPSVWEAAASRVRGIIGDVRPEELRDHVKNIHDRTVRKFLTIESIKDFAEKSSGVVRYIFEESTANRHPLFRPYAESLIEILDKVSRSLVGERVFEGIEGYSTFLRCTAASQTVPFPGTPLRGLQVLGLLETRNVSFDTVYILDANDDVLPGPGAQDLLLPHPVRTMLGLETARDREEVGEYFFNLLIKNAREVHIFYTESSKREKSRFVEKLLWKLQKEELDVSSERFEKRIKYAVRLTNSRPAPVEKTPAMVEFIETSLRYSASTLNTYLNCPLKFYYQNVLSLREKAEVSEDIDSSDVGSFVHSILKQYFQPLVGKKLSPELLSGEELESVVDRCFDAEYGKDAAGAAYFLKIQVHRQLRAFLSQYQIPAARNQTVVISAVEKDLHVTYKGRRFSGRIDRIDSRDGAPVILDYKSGKESKSLNIAIDKLDPAKRSTWNEAIRSFQLPLYMLLHSVSTGRPVGSITPAYLFLGNSHIDDSIEVKLGNGKQTPAEIYAAVEPVVFALINEILDPALPFQPTPDLPQQCPRCPYNAICGTQWTKGHYE